MGNRFDFGSDPLQYYALRVKLAEEIRANMEKKLEKPGEGYQVLRRSFNRALGQEGYSLCLTSKYIAGVHHYRSHVGAGNRLPFEPARQPAEGGARTAAQAFVLANGVRVFSATAEQTG